MPRSSATAASTSVVLGNAPRLWLIGSPHRPHRSFSSVHCRASITALPAPWSGYESGRAAQKVSAKSCFVWLWLMLGAPDRICEADNKQAGQESHVGRARKAQSAKVFDHTKHHTHTHTRLSPA